jgi:hypothetical protein
VLSTNAAAERLGRKGGNDSKEHLLECLAREMCKSWTLQQRQSYLSKLPLVAQDDLKQRLLIAFKHKKQTTKPRY